MKDIDNNVIVQKSFAFAIRCVNLCKYLREEKKEYEMSKQLIRERNEYWCKRKRSAKSSIKSRL